MSQIDSEDDMLEEYDFSNGVRGKHYRKYREGTNSVLLDPEMAKLFRDSDAVNAALKMLVKIAPDYVAQAQRSE